MKHWRWSLLVLLPLGLGLACGDDDDGDGADIGALCARGCVTVESLGCANDPPDCEADCLAEFNGFPESCRDESLAYADCSAARPASDYECDEDGESILKDGVCDAEATAAFSCILSAR